MIAHLVYFNIIGENFFCFFDRWVEKLSGILDREIGWARNICPLSHLCMVEKVLFLAQVFEIQNLRGLNILRSPESENNIFSVYLFVCLLSA